MKPTLKTLLLAIAIASLSSCSNKSNENVTTVPSFPYQEFLDSISEDDIFPIIPNDGNGFDAISDRIRYAELPESLSSNSFADSLLLFYNTILAFNTIAYDVSTAERYIDEPDFIAHHADALDSMNLSGIYDEKIRSAVANMGHEGARWIRLGKSPNKQQNTSVDEFYQYFNGIYDPFLDAHLIESYYSPSDVLHDYDKIHARAISDTTTFRDKLLQRVLHEQDFEKKCILAREFAYANFKNPERNDKELVAVLDPILRSNEYSPLLVELWLMWRTALQKTVLGSPSNDGAMYNLFYNDMRNHVALNFITHLAENPDDSVGFMNFYSLSVENNITRNSPSLFGNNSILNEMALYEEIWRN